jgi:hypothetical protein
MAPGNRAWVLPTLLAAGLAVAILGPLRTAGYIDDDWGWLALSRHLDSPLDAILNNVLGGYFWRPLPLIVDWLLGRTFDASALPRYALSAMQHALSSALVAALVWTATRRSVAAVLAGTLVAAAPAVSSLALWLSNRNELLSLNLGLAALVCLERALHAGRVTVGRAAAVALLLMLALASKESAYVFALALFCRGALAWPALPSADRWWLATALLTPVTMALAMRLLAVSEFAGMLEAESALTIATRGILAWFGLLPQSLGGFHQPAWRGLLVTSLLLLPVALALWTRKRALASAPLVVVGIVLLLVPALVQWPVTGVVLHMAGAVQVTVNQRFFALAVIGATLLSVGCLTLLRHRALPALALALAAAFGTQAAWRQTQAWSDATGAQGRAAEQAVDRVLAMMGETPPSPCVLMLRGEALPAGFADAALKARAPRGAPVLDCMVFVDGVAPWYGFARGGRCDDALMAPVRLSPTAPVIDYSGVCQRVYMLPEHARGDARILHLEPER